MGIVVGYFLPDDDTELGALVFRPASPRARPLGKEDHLSIGERATGESIGANEAVVNGEKIKKAAVSGDFRARQLELDPAAPRAGSATRRIPLVLGIPSAVCVCASRLS